LFKYRERCASGRASALGATVAAAAPAATVSFGDGARRLGMTPPHLFAQLISRR
jgi:hypothetical protein